MCGIFGYVGNKQTAAQTVLAGLKTLEYRGYDSWGVAVKHGNQIAVDKHVGKIGQAEVSLPPSTIGIGHTRWATHGGVLVKNAHPHLDCTRQIALLHNGIIENFAELKKKLIHKGHEFHSDTDTEVAVHLIEDLTKSHPFTEAVRLAFNQLHGLNALVVMHTAENIIVAVKQGSPLTIGIGTDGLYIASDAAGIISDTKRLVFVEDDQLVVLGEKLLVLGAKSGEPIEPTIETVNWEVVTTKKGKYAHFMVKEIAEQPTIIRALATSTDANITSMAEHIANAKGTFFIAAGTAYHAAMAGVYIFSRVAHKHINTAIASEFNYYDDFLTNKSLVIALSQSGETIDVIEPLKRAKEKGSKVMSITNTLGSTIYRMSDEKVLLGAGVEKAVASTKAYVAKVAVLLMLAYGQVKQEKAIKGQLLQAAKDIEAMLAPKPMAAIKRLAGVLQHTEHIYVIGRGQSYSSALEAALKIKEVSYIHTEGLAGGELKHGTIALISKGTPCIVFAPNDETYESTISNAIEIKSRGGLIIGISFQPNDAFEHYIHVPDAGDATLISQIVPAQLLAYYLAVVKDLDPDMPRNLAKSVTVK